MLRFRARLADETGASLVLTLIALMGLLGAAALAVDVGVLVTARSDAQRAADAAALAGASALLDDEPPSEAEARAIDLAGQNAIFGGPIEPDEVEVEVDVARGTVRAVIRRPEIATYFARVIGVDPSGVMARATAQVSEAPTASCVKPLAVPDPDPDGETGLRFQTGQQIQLNPGAQSYVLPGQRGGGSSRSGGSQSRRTMAWVLPTSKGWSGPCSSGAAAHTPPAYRANLCSCNRAEIDLKTSRSTVAGSQGGLRPHTRGGFDRLVDQDPGAYWDVARKRVAGSRFSSWRSSPRVVVIPLYDPGATGNDMRPTRFIRVFVEGATGSGGTINARFVGSVRSLRLIE